METKNLTIAAIKAMDLSEVNTVLTSGDKLTPAQRQALTVRKTHLEGAAQDDSSPVEKIQEQMAQDSITTDAPENNTPEGNETEVKAPVVVAKGKNKPFETTRTIDKFADDTKGIRAGHMVTFTEHKGGTGKVLTGQVQRLFDFWLKPERQEAKIMVTDAKGNKTRFYRFEKDITPVVAPVEEPAGTEGSGI